ncbi:hypothetical protein HYE67_001401 [Fusarium culmorum]|uniref:Uncharacterized protein n=1 Tax=Fusarium culmorum TaxID=5516 RepID=A0A2T4GT56_FUSCU|nr:hypothetical protein FCULG_00005537 [Fusarium culmorum]QPC59170.1 hypothetical protein HYE67_001401 [Fusarium culmorum]
MPIVLVNPAENQLLFTTASLDNVYRFVGTLPSPLTDLFSTDMLLRLFQEDESIRTVLLEIGDAYVNNNGRQVQSQKGSMLLDIKQRELYATIQTRLKNPDPHLDSSLLLLAVLFCLLQLMTTRSSNISLQIVDQVNSSIVQRRGPHGFSTKFDNSTLFLFRLLEGVGNLIRDQDTSFADAKWCKTINHQRLSELPITREPNTFLFECILTFISSLAEINVQYAYTPASVVRTCMVLVY